MKRIIAVLTAFLLGALNINAQNLLPQGVSVHKLDNGLEVLLIENHALPMVGINTVVKVGSAYETFATSGMSHMLEHLLFNGTDSLTQRELYDAVDLIGGYNNANTSEFYTNFMMVTPAENIYEGMKIQSQMLFHSVLPENKYEKEKGIVLEEIGKTLANPREQLERNIISILYQGHALSLPTLGTYETIKNMKRDDVYAFYKNYYKPNNMIVSVIGNFNSKQMLKWLNELYGSESPGVVEYPKYPHWATGLELANFPFDGTFHRFYDGKQIHLQIFYALPAGYPDEFYGVFEDEFSEFTDSLKKAIDAKFPGAVKEISASVRNKYIVSHLEIDMIVTKRNSYDGIVETVQKEIPNFKIELSDEKIAEYIAGEKTSFLKNAEKPHMFGIFNAEIFAVKGIEGVLEKYSGEGYKKAKESSQNFSLDFPPIVLLQEPFNPASAGKAGNKIITKAFPSKNDLPAIIARQNKNSNLLAVHYLLGHKSDYEKRYGANAAYVWHAAFGLRTESDDFKKRAAKFGFEFTVNDNPYIPMDDIYLSPDFGYIRVESATSDISGAIEFLNNEFLNFVPTEKEFNSALRQYKMSQMMKRVNRAKSEFERLVSKTLYGKEENDAKKNLTYGSLLDFGRHYFIPANMVISVVSNLEPEKVAELFSDFRASVPKDFISSKPEPKTFLKITEPVTIEKDYNSKRAYLYYGFQKEIEKSERAALKALSLILQDKIVFDIREKQGMAYHMSAGVEIRENRAMFYIELGTRPENVEKLKAQFPEKFSEDYLGEITETELKKRVNHYLGRMLFRRLSSINQGFYLGRSYYYYGDFSVDRKKLENLKKVTVKEVQKVAEKYLAPENEVLIIVK